REAFGQHGLLSGFDLIDVDQRDRGPAGVDNCDILCLHCHLLFLSLEMTKLTGPGVTWHREGPMLWVAVISVRSFSPQQELNGALEHLVAICPDSRDGWRNHDVWLDTNSLHGGAVRERHRGSGQPNAQATWNREVRAFAKRTGRRRSDHHRSR